MKSIKEILIRRDGLSPEEAEEQIQQAQMVFNEYLEDGDIELAENICQEFFGLEPDYLCEFY